MSEINREHRAEKIDYEDVGKWMKRIRIQNGMTQKEVADCIHVERSVLSKFENGKVKPDWKYIVSFAEYFNEDYEDIKKKVSYAIPDTCALVKNRHLIHMLLEDYEQVIIPSTVSIELSHRKTLGKGRSEGAQACQVLNTIEDFINEYPSRIKRMDSDCFRVNAPDKNLENDLKIIALANAVKDKIIGDVFIISDDIDMRSNYPKVMQVKEYLAHRNADGSYSDLLKLDAEYENIEYYTKLLPRLNINAYLTDGATLLISCIRCKTMEKTDELGFQPTDREKYHKIKFLIDNGVDINKNDNGKRCLPPISHCVQVDDWRTFNILLEAGCDFNKGSRDESRPAYLLDGKHNEGNTALMIACFMGKKKYVEKLCSLPGISLNQQDNNGFTALIKCAYQRAKRKEKGLPYKLNEDIYQYLLDHGADPLIRDRNNHTAEDWWKHTDNPEYKGEEQW